MMCNLTAKNCKLLTPTSPQTIILYHTILFQKIIFYLLIFNSITNLFKYKMKAET